MSTDAEFIVAVSEIKDPLAMLKVIVENETLWGYNPYYRDLRRAMLNRAEIILRAHGIVPGPLAQEDGDAEIG